MKVLLYRAVILAIFFHFTICVYGQANFSSVCVIEQRSKLPRPCKFPFIFKERLFNNCTDYADEKGKHWCSTNVNSNQKHISQLSFQPIFGLKTKSYLHNSIFIARHHYYTITKEKKESLPSLMLKHQSRL